MATIEEILHCLNSNLAHSFPTLCYLLLWIAAGLYVAYNVTLQLPAGVQRLTSLAFPFIPALFLLSILIPSPLLRAVLAFTIWLSAFKLTLLCFGKHIDTWTKWWESSFSHFALAFLLPIQIKSDSKAPQGLLTVALKTVVEALSYAVLLILYLHVRATSAAAASTAAFLAVSVVHCLALYIYIDFPNRLSGFCLRLFHGVEILPIFSNIWLSSSITDFWGNRWDLIANAMLRQGVYQPVIRRLSSSPAAADGINNANPSPTSGAECTAGQQLLRAPTAESRVQGQKRLAAAKPAQLPLRVRVPAVLATFFVSGVLHELIFLAISDRPSRLPNFRATSFFVLHGIVACAEICVKRITRPGASDARCACFLASVIRHTPYSFKVFLTLFFAYASAAWLFFPSLEPVFLRVASEFAATLHLIGINVRYNANLSILAS